MLIYENFKAKLLNILKFGINPFKKFVSTGEIREDLGLTTSRKPLLDKIMEIVENNENCILPIIGDVGTGKTHLYWALKNRMYYHNTIYLSLEEVYKRFFYTIYSEFIEVIGLEPLRNIVNQLVNEWGALERKFGFFHISDVEKIRAKALQMISDNFDEDEKVALHDVVTGISTHQLDPYKKIDAERWLLGEIMDIKELTHLNMMHDLTKNRNAYVMLKLLIENSKLGTILYIDDFESIVQSYPSQEDTEEVFDPSWLYGKEDSPDEILSQKLLRRVLKLQKINGLRIIVTLKSKPSLDEVKKAISKVDESIIEYIKDPIFLSEFEEKDIFEFYIKNMKNFLENGNFTKIPDTTFKDYFPLNQKILENIYIKSKGNPREILKFLIKIFNDIIFSNQKLSQIREKYEILT
ncbi:MAG: hypothetical protein EU542_03865 [Promethearchaeota archaeon]|nr:MAG: hypothetical protein EU542_03865 [Candidatus Lokiarchaeota archaeon]